MSTVSARPAFDCGGSASWKNVLLCCHVTLQVLLQPIVGHLDELGFTCFLESSVQLFLLSRCWSPAYEWKTWSNVICVNRDYGGQLDALLRMTALWGRVVARGSGTALGQQHPGMRS